MQEDKEKMKGIIFKLEKKANARIYKLERIKTTFNAKLALSSQNTQFKLDFSLFKSIAQTRTELFSSVFSISKKKSDTVATNVNILLLN